MNNIIQLVLPLYIWIWNLPLKYDQPAIEERILTWCTRRKGFRESKVTTIEMHSMLIKILKK